MLTPEQIMTRIESLQVAAQADIEAANRYEYLEGEASGSHKRKYRKRKDASLWSAERNRMKAQELIESVKS
jgi:hypothetical protein